MEQSSVLKIDERDQSKSNYHYSYNRFYCNCILGSKYCLRFYVVENQNQPQQRCITWFNLRYTVACHCFIATVKCVYKRSVIIYRLRVGGRGGEGGLGCVTFFWLCHEEIYPISPLPPVRFYKFQRPFPSPLIGSHFFVVLPPLLCR